MSAWASGAKTGRGCGGKPCLVAILVCLAAAAILAWPRAAWGQQAAEPAQSRTGDAQPAVTETKPPAAPATESKPAVEPVAPEQKTEAVPAQSPAAAQPPAGVPPAASEQPKPAPAAPETKPPEPPPPPKPVELPPGVVARVNGQDVTQQELEKRLLQFFGERVRDMMIQQALIRQEAAAQGLTATEQDLDEMENEFYAKSPLPPGTSLAERKAKWAESLAAHAVTREDFRHELEVDVLLKKLLSRRVNITDEQVRREFLRRHGERLVLRQIVVKTREEAEELHKQLTAGASFDELAKTKSTDARTRIEGGKLREPLARGKAPNFTYEDVAFHLSLGQISSPFEVEGQWYILKLEEKLPPADVKFEDVKEKYRQELAAREEMTSRDALLRELFQKAKIERGRFVAPPAEGPGGKPASPPADTSPPTPPESKGAAP